MAPGIDDGVPVDVNGTVDLETSAQVQAQFAGATLTPTTSFAFMWRGATVQFAAGDSVPVTADLLAALTAAGAPFSQP